MERSIRELIAEIRYQEKQKEAARSHQVARRCTSCGYRSVCDQRLG
jgi:CRISPR/Cas system-associated exonuclease Cas4 (RecB family)